MSRSGGESAMRAQYRVAADGVYCTGRSVLHRTVVIVLDFGGCIGLW